MGTTDRYDVVIAGGGTMGTAAAWALSKRGFSTALLEQYDHVHTLGSHGGHTRIFRHAYSEGADYVPLMHRADKLWVELGEQLGLEIVHRVGILEMDGPGGAHAKNARQAGRQHDIPYEWLDAAEIRQRWPAFNPPDGWEGGFSDRGGFLEVEPAMKGMAVLASRNGMTMFPNTAMQSWKATGEGVEVGTGSGTLTANRLIIAGGAWTSQLLPELDLPLTVIRKVLCWLDVENPGPFLPEVFPVFAADTGMDELYGFPIFGQPGLKVATHLGGQITTPATIDRHSDSAESDSVFSTMEFLLPGVSRRVIASSVCMYTRTPDEHFIIDRHPEHPAVVFACGFSGHGYKFATEIGEHLAALATDAATEPYDLFKRDRFGPGFSV